MAANWEALVTASKICADDHGAALAPARRFLVSAIQSMKRLFGGDIAIG